MASKSKFYIEYSAQFRASAFENQFEKSMECLVQEIKKQYYDRKKSGISVNWRKETGQKNGKSAENLLFYEAFRKKIGKSAEPDGAD